jgi:hypothetical protein
MASAKKDKPAKSAVFHTDSPRHLRLLHVLMKRKLTRTEVDSVAGASNGPDEMKELRDKGLTSLFADKEPIFDRDGRKSHQGIYSPSSDDRRTIARFLSGVPRETMAEALLALPSKFA